MEITFRSNSWPIGIERVWARKYSNFPTLEDSNFLSTLMTQQQREYCGITMISLCLELPCSKSLDKVSPNKAPVHFCDEHHPIHPQILPQFFGRTQMADSENNFNRILANEELKGIFKMTIEILESLLPIENNHEEQSSGEESFSWVWELSIENHGHRMNFLCWPQWGTFAPNIQSLKTLKFGFWSSKCSDGSLQDA